MLRTLGGLAALAAVDLFGEWVARATSAPLPGNVLGMLFLAIALGAGLVPLGVVERGADLLLKWLALLFVPAAVSVIRYGALLRPALVGIAIVTVVTTALVLVVTGLVAERLLRREQGRS